MARKRRNFDAQFKTRVVLELLAGKKSLAEASREYNIKDTVLYGSTGQKSPITR
jgi:transposase-like protein